VDQSHPSAGNGVNTVESAIASAFRVDSKAGALRSALVRAKGWTVAPVSGEWCEYG
jgi:hypothetical protein